MNFNTDHLESGYFASDLSIGGASDCSITCWAYAESFNRGGIYEVGNAGVTQNMFALRTRDPGESGGGTDVWTTNHWGAVSGDYSYTITGSLNTWTFFVVTYDTAGTDTSETYAAILDTDDEVTSRGSLAMTLNLTDFLPFSIGRFNQANEGNPVDFDGRIADVRVYNRVLALTEMQTIFMSKGHDAISENLQLRMPLRNGDIGFSAASFFVDSTQTSHDGTGGSPAQLTVTVPTNTDGDLLVALICPGGDSSGTPANVTTPSGWTLIANGDVTGAVSNPSVWVFRRTASSEPGTYVFTYDEDCAAVGHMVSYHNVSLTEDTVSSVNTGSSTSPQCDSVTTVGDFLTLRFACADDNDAQDDENFFPNGVNIREYTQQAGNDASTGNGCTVGFGDELRSTSPSGTRDYTLAATEEWATFTITFEADADTLWQHGISPNRVKMIARDTTGCVRIADPLR